MASWSSLGFSVACVFVVLTACGSSDEDLPCVTVSTDCNPIVNPPTFKALYDNVLLSSCATGTGNCHGAAASGGLDLRTIDSAFAGLSARVQPQDLGCSLVLRRIEAASSTARMPPGPTPLSEAQRCAIRQWIANGAQR